MFNPCLDVVAVPFFSFVFSIEPCEDIRVQQPEKDEFCLRKDQNESSIKEKMRWWVNWENSNSGKRVSWNEANLREIEANKQETKKFDEPKTPYPSTIEEDGSSVKCIDFAAHAEALKNALNKLAFTEEHNSPFGETCQDEDQGLAKQKDTVSFEERRRAHYDEFNKVKDVQGKGCSLDDELDNSIHVSGLGSTLDIDSIEIDIEDDDEILQIIDIEETDDLSFPQYSHFG